MGNNQMLLGEWLVVVLGNGWVLPGERSGVAWGTVRCCVGRVKKIETLDHVTFAFPPHCPLSPIHLTSLEG